MSFCRGSCNDGPEKGVSSSSGPGKGLTFAQMVLNKGVYLLWSWKGVSVQNGCKIDLFVKVCCLESLGQPWEGLLLTLTPCISLAKPYPGYMAVTSPGSSGPIFLLQLGRMLGISMGHC